METATETWVCSQCTHSGSANVDEWTFRDQHTLQEHLRKKHKPDATEIELSIAARYSRQMKPLRCCLICGSAYWIPSGTSEQSETSMRNQNDLFLSDMSAHLKALGLASLPWHLNNDVEAWSSEAQGSDRESMSSSEWEQGRRTAEAAAEAATRTELTLDALREGERAVPFTGSLEETAKWVQTTEAHDPVLLHHGAEVDEELEDISLWGHLPHDFVPHQQEKPVKAFDSRTEGKETPLRRLFKKPSKKLLASEAGSVDDLGPSSPPPRPPAGSLLAPRTDLKWHQPPKTWSEPGMWQPQIPTLPELEAEAHEMVKVVERLNGVSISLMYLDCLIQAANTRCTTGTNRSGR